MIVKYTEEEKAKALEIEERYRKEIIKAQDGADRTRIAYEMTMALRDFANECRKEHFKQFANDPAAIIANAEEIAVAVLEELHNLFNRPFSSHIDFDELEECIVRNGDNILIKSDYATQCILDELELHAEALKDKRDKDKLFAVVAGIVRDSEYIERKEIPTPLIAAIPNDALTAFIMRALIASKIKEKDGELKAYGLKNDPKNRHEKIESYLQRKKREGKDRLDILIHATNNSQDEEFFISLKNADILFGKRNASFLKIFMYCLQEMNAQNYPESLQISLQKMVNIGMYSSVGNAYTAIDNFYEKQKNLETSAKVKYGDKVIGKEKGMLFTNIRHDVLNRYVTLTINKANNLAEFFTKYFTILPQFAYSLSSSGFMLTWYIFYRARQNTKSIADKNYFTMNLDKVREYLGLLDPDEIQKNHNRKYKQYIYTPIMKTIKEINDKCRETEKEECDKFEIELKAPEFKTATVKEWLRQGYIEIHLDGAFSEGFKSIARKTEQDRQRWLKQKEEAKARAIAKKGQ